MIRGFVTGVAWGGVVAGLGLAVISQVAPGPVPPVEQAMLPVGGGDVAEDSRSAPVPQTPPAPVAEQPIPTPAPVGVAPDAPAAPDVIVSVAPPAPDALPTAGPTAIAPELPQPELPPPEPPAPQATVPDAPAPGTQTAVAPEATSPAPLLPPATASGVPAALDMPPPPPDEALLGPAPAPQADLAPARITPDPDPEAQVMPAPEAVPPLADVTPDLPIAKPLPVPEVAGPEVSGPEVAGTGEAGPDGAVPEAAVSSPDKPAPGLEPVRPIIAEDAPSTLAPDPGLPSAEGVKVGQLPKIGADTAVVTDPVPDDSPPVQRFARTFDNPDAKPLFSILLRDTGEANLDRAALAAISFPVTFVLDPMQPGAAEAAQVYRRGGQEVLMLASGIPEGATPADLEQTFQSLSSVLPEAVGVMDQANGGFQANRPLATQVVPILAAQGRGLVTFDAGLNAADQEARRAALPAALIFRRLDAEGEATPTIRRYLDRAAFKAAQEGRVVVLGDTRPETVAALLEWAVEGRAASVALAPVTAVMTVP